MTSASTLFRFGLLAALLSLPAMLARAADPSPLDAVAQRLADEFDSSKPNRGDYAAWFSEAFLKAVPEAQLGALIQQLRSQHGKVERVLPRPDNQKTTGIFDFHFAGAQMQVTLSIDAAAPHRITGLFFASPVPRLRSLDEVKVRLEKLHGEVSVSLVSLKDDKTLLAVNADTPLAIASAFKLYILAELVRQEKPWDTVVTLREEMKSLPSGDMRKWPAGSPITIHTLAVAMISMSDNTATDMLLHVAGREKVQAAMADLGMKEPERNIPLLSSQDAFRLKADETLARQFLEKDAAGRAAMLGTLTGRPMPRLDQIPAGKPLYIDQIEWFASANDLTRLIKWFDARNDPTAMGILTINPGLPIAPTKFPTVAFKGGSEAGVLNLTYLLRSAKGNHYALAASWNNPKSEVDLTELAGLVLAAIDLLE